MRGSGSRKESRRSRRNAPSIEGLDTKDLLSLGALGPALGPYVSPATSLPQVTTRSVIVDPHVEINTFLSGQLGMDMTQVEQQADAQQASLNNHALSSAISQPFIHVVLSRQDTYTLLGQAVSATGGSLSGVYSTTGPLIVNALQTGSTHGGPNGPPRIPGLRLVKAISHDHNFPNNHTNTWLYELHVAVERQVLSLSDRQSGLVSQGFSQFLTQVGTLNQEGVLSPAVPPAAPALPRGPLRNTLYVSLGALRNLASVTQTLSGLQLPSVGNFPGRIDVGVVLDRAGDFGIAFTARGPLSPAPTNVASPNALAGDVRIEVSNAPNLAALNGLSTAEGLIQGAALSGEIETSKLQDGVSTFGASVGYGSGLEFGTGMAYTQVVPLGNVYALIPEFPGTG